MIFSHAMKFLSGALMCGLLFSSPLSAGDTAAAPTPLVLVLLGPPGAGKGTQAVLLRDHLKLPHISTGDLLREHIRTTTDLGKLAQVFMDKGQLVPDDLILDMLFERVSQPDCANGYILDGFPRTLPQAEALQKRLNGSSVPIVINLNISDAKIIERLAQRIVCEKCGTPYHLLYSPSKIKNTCDKCGGALVQRADDTEAVIAKRLKVYHEQTAPLIAFYTQNKMLHTVDCDQAKEKIFAQVVDFLHN